MLALIVFWAFQVINGLSSVAMFLAPKKSHESMFKEPERVYRELGFSHTAVEMLHNVLRGQGAALLAITVFLAFNGSSQKSSYLLIVIACSLTLIAHLLTLRHHLKDETVMRSLGSVKSMYPLIAINVLLIVGAAIVWLSA